MIQKLFRDKANWILLAIVVLAGFLRINRIQDYMTFLGDEGRDVLVVKHLIEGHLVGLGPTSSVGGFFTGPIYYYFMAPFLWLFHFDPVGPAVMVALFSLATIVLMYVVAKDFFNEKVGLIACLFYAIAPLVIGYSRSSWNPNLMPFFTLAGVYSIYYALRKQSWKLFFLVGIIYGILLQLHYIETFFAIILASYIAFYKIVIHKKKAWIQVKETIFQTFVMFIGFLVSMLPFLGFEIKHGFPNTKAVVSFAFGKTGETGFSITYFITTFFDVVFRLFGRVVFNFPAKEHWEGMSQTTPFQFYFQVLVVWIVIISSFSLLYYSVKRNWKDHDKVQKYVLLAFWITIGILLFGLYKKPIYEYYFEFMFPLPVLLVGFLLQTLWKWKRSLGKTLAILLFWYLLVLNWKGYPFQSEPNRQLLQARTIAEFVLDKAEGKPFNFALITGGNSDHAYRYFFEVEGNTPITLDHGANALADPKTVTNQLLVVCESLPCEPLGNSLWEVAGFGRAEITGSWDVSVVKVYRLVHYQEPGNKK